jgi:hypothetical protein
MLASSYVTQRLAKTSTTLFTMHPSQKMVGDNYIRLIHARVAAVVCHLFVRSYYIYIYYIRYRKSTIATIYQVHA